MKNGITVMAAELLESVLAEASRRLTRVCTWRGLYWRCLP
jgi:hypothetical protein